MLTALRSSAGSWIAKIFIAVLALSFGVWGIADVFRGSRSDVLATVGDHKVTAAQFSEAFNRQVRIYSQRLGQAITPDQARQIGLDRQVLNDLLSAGALEDQAAKLGVSVSDKTVAQRVADNPSFQNSKGEFDPASFRRLLQANGLSEGQFIAFERRQMVRNTVISLITADVPVPDTLVEMVWRQRNEKRDVALINVSAEGISVAEPTAQEIKAYYDAHQNEFAVPERRMLTIIPVQPETIADTIEVSDADVKRIYDERKDLFATPEKRTIEQIAFKSEADAQAAYAAIEAGTKTFEDEAKARGLKDDELKLGEFSEAQFPDQTIAKDVFALSEGQVSKPMKGRLSTILVKVTKIVPGEQKTLDQARPEITKLLRADKSRDKVLDLYGQVEDARASGSTLEEIAANLKLPLVKLDKVDRKGQLPDGKEADIPARADVLSTAFESDVGVENDPVPTKEDGYVWVDVREVFPARSSRSTRSKTRPPRAGRR